MWFFLIFIFKFLAYVELSLHSRIMPTLSWQIIFDVFLYFVFKYLIKLYGAYVYQGQGPAVVFVAPFPGFDVTNTGSIEGAGSTPSLSSF